MAKPSMYYRISSVEPRGVGFVRRTACLAPRPKWIALRSRVLHTHAARFLPTLNPRARWVRSMQWLALRLRVMHTPTLVAAHAPCRSRPPHWALQRSRAEPASIHPVGLGGGACRGRCRTLVPPGKGRQDDAAELAARPPEGRRPARRPRRPPRPDATRVGRRRTSAPAHSTGRRST